MKATGSPRSPRWPRKTSVQAATAQSTRRLPRKLPLHRNERLPLVPRRRSLVTKRATRNLVARGSGIRLFQLDRPVGIVEEGLPRLILLAGQLEIQERAA